jgi:O-antigen/teichoic acid export membrane protein
MPAAPYSLRVNTQYALTGGLAMGLLALGRSFWVARALPPAAFGAWSVLQLVLLYGGSCHLGVAIALPNEMVAREARQDLDGSRELARSGCTLTLGLGAAFALATLVLPRALLGDTLAQYRCLFAMTFFSQQLFMHVGSLLRGQMQFQRIALAQTVFGAGSILLMIVLLPLLGIRGGLIAMLAANLAGACVGAGVLRHYGFGRVPAAAFRFLLAAGLPLLVTFLVGTGLQSVDRVLVGRMLGQGPLGYYSVSNVFIMPVMFLPGVLGGLLMTHFSRAAVVASSRAMRDDLLGFSWAVGVVLALVTGCIFATCGGLLRQFMPRYQASLPTVRILLVGSYFYASTLALGNFLLACKREVGLLGVQGASLAILAGLCLLAILARQSLEGVGWANLLAYLGNFMLVVAFARRTMGWDWTYAGRLVGACLGPLAYMILVYGLCRPLEQLWVARGIFTWACLLHLVALTAASLPLVFVTLKWAPWRTPVPVGGSDG